MPSNATLRKVVWIAVALLAAGAVAGVSGVAGWWLGYQEGLAVARMEAAATLRTEVEVASALRIGNPRQATLLLELGIDDRALRLLEANDNPAVFGVLTRLHDVSPEFALGAAQVYRGLIASPDPQGAVLARRLAALPKAPVPVTPSLGLLLTKGAAASEAPKGPDVETKNISRDGDTVYVHYTTLRALVDCPGQAIEMNDVWTRIVKEQLRDPPIRTVVLFPSDLGGRSASFGFTSNASGRWRAEAPCVIEIAP